MDKCEKIDMCAFYSGSLRMVPGPSAYMKAEYCHKRPSSCLRFRNDGNKPVSDQDNRVTPLGLINIARGSKPLRQVPGLLALLAAIR